MFPRLNESNTTKIMWVFILLMFTCGTVSMYYREPMVISPLGQATVMFSMLAIFFSGVSGTFEYIRDREPTVLPEPKLTEEVTFNEENSNV